MKLILSLSLLLPLLVCGQKAPEIPRLSGIINLPEFRRAVFELREDCCSPRQLVLTEGETMWGVKLLSISPAHRSVQVSVEGATDPVTLSLPGRANSSAVSAPSIELVDASIYSVLELYGRFCGKTLLYWPKLPTGGISVNGPPVDGKEAARLLQTALADKQISSVADGDKFITIVPTDRVATLKPHGPGPVEAPSGNKAQDAVPPGMIAFHGTMIENVYFIYADLIGAKLDRSATRPTPIQPFIFLYTQSALSPDEVVYAFDTILAWQGVKMVRGQDGSVRPVQQQAK